MGYVLATSEWDCFEVGLKNLMSTFCCFCSSSDLKCLFECDSGYSEDEVCTELLMEQVHKSGGN